MALRIVEEAALTDVGRQRSANEDAFYMSAPVFAVADGMGGARAGEVASGMVAEAFGQASMDGHPEAALETVIKDANRRIFDLAQSDESRAGMGTTVTSMIAGENDVAFGHVGDSRAYRMRGEELERLTEDHSLVEELRRQGRISEEEAETHPQRSIITRAAGPEADVEVDTFTSPAKDGDIYLLCSDGLTGMVNERRIAELLRSGSSLESVAGQLIDEANANGGRDNITVVLVRLAEDSGEGGEEDTFTGAETGAISAAEIEAAQAEATPQEAEPRPDATMIMSREEVQARAAADPARPAKRPRRRIGRKALGALLVVAIIGALGIGLYAGSRQFYFVGTDDHGLVTLFRGLPYELPAGVKLYSEQYATAIPARTLTAKRRKQLVDHELRSKGDATDLVKQIEDRTIR